MKRKIKSDELKLINAKKDKAAADDISAHITSNLRISEGLIQTISKNYSIESELHTSITNTYAIYAIYKNKSYCGYIELNKRKKKYELGIDILPKHQKHGITTKAIVTLCSYLYKKKGIKKLLLRIMVNNTASISMFEKLGAKLKKER